MVKKNNGKWRMCVDFTDLNKACSKDSFPLPRIDYLIDNALGHQLLSFMVAFSGYNQIMMAEKDREKTAFITESGTYYSRVMPFGLKNTGATYQRLVNKLFKQQIGRNVEVYVDDMLVKSTKENDHVKDLRETFKVQKRYNMKLNLQKCVFGVTAGKFLGFMVTNRGIEANPDKIKAILDLEEPKTLHDIQKLNGKLAALSRFLAKGAERSLPFLKLLKGVSSTKKVTKARPVTWDDECKRTFEELKMYLMSPPLLTRPRPGETLIIYMAVTSEAGSSVLMREENSVQFPIYYVSNIFKSAEVRYSRVEKIGYTLLLASRRLRPYFQAHTIQVMTDVPLGKYFTKLHQSGRMLNWGVELSEFDLKYVSRSSMKGQVMADFVVECTIPQPEDEPQDKELQPWILHVDGASNEQGGGAGVVIESPEGLVTEHALRFGFKASNNAAEYEAVLAGLDLAKSAGAKRVHVNSDSALVVGQSIGEFEAREESMKRYQEKVRQSMANFDEVVFSQIPRTNNTRADALAKLASSPTNALEPTIYVEYLVAPSIGKE